MLILEDISELNQSNKILIKSIKQPGYIKKNNINNEEQKLLQLFLQNKAKQKIEYYDKKISEMKQKYDMDFSTFQKKIYLKPVEVDFEEWNDFVLWGGYVKAYKYWAQFC